jgi:CubicO group peptidase (beta-lactamase class C family)
MVVHGDHISPSTMRAQWSLPQSTCFSVSKSIVGILGRALASEGVLTLRSRSLRTSQLARSGYSGATLRHLLDSRAARAAVRSTIAAARVTSWACGGDVDQRRLRCAVGALSGLARPRTDGGVVSRSCAAIALVGPPS